MYRLQREGTGLVVIDVQEKLTPAMDQEIYEAMRTNTVNLVKGFNAMNAPVFVTQQYTKGLGGTVSEIMDEFDGEVLEKTTFSCCGEKSFVEDLRNAGVETVVIAGMETHVCVLQTAVDLIYEGFRVHIAGDAVCSRNEFNWDTALNYMENAGAVITCAETVLFQMVKDAKESCFKEISKIVK